MNDLLTKITPITRSVIWLHNGELDSDSPVYRGVDYLLNGLLTASLGANKEIKNRVILTTSFGHPLHVYVSGEFVKTEYESFLKLLSKDLNSESTILVIDEADAFKTLQKNSPADIQSRMQLFK